MQWNVAYYAKRYQEYTVHDNYARKNYTGVLTKCCKYVAIHGPLIIASINALRKKINEKRMSHLLPQLYSSVANVVNNVFSSSDVIDAK